MKTAGFEIITEGYLNGTKIIYEELDELIETANDIDCAIDDILFPNGVDTRNYAVPYWNEETGVFIWVSLVAYVAMIALDWTEQDTPCGLTRLLEFYKAPKSERKAIVAQLVADVSN